MLTYGQSREKQLSGGRNTQPGDNHVCREHVYIYIYIYGKRLKSSNEFPYIHICSKD